MSAEEEKESTEPATSGLWLLDPSSVRDQLLVVATGERHLAFPAGMISGVDERNTVYPVPCALGHFLGIVPYRGQFVPLLDGEFLCDPESSAQAHADRMEIASPEDLEDLMDDLSFEVSGLLLVLESGEDLLGLAFDRFIGFAPPSRHSDPPGEDLPKWIKSSGTTEGIPVLVVDTPALFEYCRGRSP